MKSRDLIDAPQAGIECIAQPIADQVKGRYSKQDGKPGKQRQPGLRGNVVLTFADHHAPFRSRRLGAKTNKA